MLLPAPALVHAAAAAAAAAPLPQARLLHQQKQGRQVLRLLLLLAP
jgi:hypothetical protein